MSGIGFSSSVTWLDEYRSTHLGEHAQGSAYGVAPLLLQIATHEGSEGALSCINERNCAISPCANSSVADEGQPVPGGCSER
jgi:hypothetical protein